MKTVPRLIILAIFATILLMRAAETVKKPWRRSLELSAMRLLDQAEKDCAHFYPTSRECVQDLFYDLWRWEVIQDQDRIVGPPGVPGPAGDGDGKWYGRKGHAEWLRKNGPQGVH